MRKVTFTPEMVSQFLQWLKRPTGARAEFTVHVDWPELQLSEEKVVANAAARAWGHPEPHPDNAIFSIVLPFQGAK